ncbi:hypothetical protein [uncultured Pseudokineococcus sp.]|uniref:hypothetical protein n=1 Tax=uncultured Pseudokineococcus sp. TaxID=1642928 RepID=UPI0026238613|nr:hypothetical protein [uncultured Pseudokineococcus sp.]
MLVVWSVVVVALGATLVHHLLAGRRPGWRRRRVERLGLVARLPGTAASAGGLLPDALVERVGLRLARRQAGASAGALVGALLTLVLLARGSDLDRRGAVVEGSASTFPEFAVDLSLLPLLGVFLVLVGQAAGALVVVAREALAPPVEGARRLARPTSPVLADYVPRLDTAVVRLLSLAPLVVVLALGAASLALPRVLPRGYATLVVFAGVAAAAWLVTEWLCRRVLARRQPAGSSLELAWDDVLRARALRDLVPLPLMLAAFACGLTPFAVLGGEPGRGLLAAGAAFGTVLVLLGLLLTLLVSLVVQPSERYVRARLWPLPADPAGADPAMATSVAP